MDGDRVQTGQARNRGQHLHVEQVVGIEHVGGAAGITDHCSVTAHADDLRTSDAVSGTVPTERREVDTGSDVVVGDRDRRCTRGSRIVRRSIDHRHHDRLGALDDDVVDRCDRHVSGR